MKHNTWRNINGNNINNETDIYLDITDEEFLDVISLNLPNFLINTKYMLLRG